MNTALELLGVKCQGVKLEPVEGKLRIRAAEPLDEVIVQLIRQRKAMLLSLLEPERDPDTGVWDAPELPPKGSLIPTRTEGGKPAYYRVSLFGVSYLIRFEPSIGDTHISAVDQAGVPRMFASLNELARWAWAESYGKALIYREVK